jgi:MFS family permease
VAQPVAARRNLSLFLCAVLHGLNHALQLVLPPLYLAMRDDLGMGGLSRIMLLGTIYFVTYAVTGLPYGILGDRFSKKKILVVGTLVNSVAFLMAAQTRSYGVLVAAMVLGGLGGGCYHPVGNALISNLFRDMVGRAFGIIGVGASLGLFLGPFAGGFLGEHFGWRTSCLVFALFGSAVGVAFGILMPEEEKFVPSEKEKTLPPRALLMGLLPVILVFGMRDFCLWGATYLTPVMSQMSVGFSEKTAGLLIGLMSLTGVLSQPLGGFMSDRFGRRRVLAFALTVAGVGIVFFPHAGPVLLFPVALLSGFMILGTVPVVDAAAAQIVPPSMRGRLFGLTITLGILLGALSPYVVGMIYDLSGGYGVPFLVIGLGGFAGAALSLTVLPK